MPQLYSGSQAVDNATEWSCTTDTAGPDADTTPGHYQLFLDLTNLADGDALDMKVYDKIVSGGSQMQIGPTENIVGAQSSKGWYSKVYPLIHGWDFTLKLTTANARTIVWSIREVTAGAAVVMATGGIQSGSFTAGAIDAAAIAANAIGESEHATITERTQAAPPDATNIAAMIAYIYEALINDSESTATVRKIKNGAGTVIAKGTQAEVAGVYTGGKLVSGP